MGTKCNGNPTKHLFFSGLRCEREKSEDGSLEAIATLGLFALVSDGNPKATECSALFRFFHDELGLTHEATVSLMSRILCKFKEGSDPSLIDEACRTLSERLDTQSRLAVLNGISNVVVCDGHVHEGEELYLEYLALRLGVRDQLKFPKAEMEDPIPAPYCKLPSHYFERAAQSVNTQKIE